MPRRRNISGRSRRLSLCRSRQNTTSAMTSDGYWVRFSEPPVRSLNCLPQSKADNGTAGSPARCAQAALKSPPPDTRHAVHPPCSRTQELSVARSEPNLPNCDLARTLTEPCSAQKDHAVSSVSFRMDSFGFLAQSLDCGNYLIGKLMMEHMPCSVNDPECTLRDKCDRASRAGDQYRRSCHLARP